MSEIFNAQKFLLIALLTALVAGALMYEVLHPTLFPLLKQGILQLLYHIPVFTQPGNVIYLESATSLAL